MESVQYSVAKKLWMKHTNKELFKKKNIVMLNSHREAQ